ncbi:prepilin-type N-terminal cleavage/methylation domain-containing protein [Endozoicomonas gorgoniicola]|uniref:Prepilin-type N-terminal cleavage/methylation domain-containing protein n=1 Tax=Endozoicomonas gorgoniicola TaxID=1234144 RepID=A0ABT3MXW1_9GAMM|nr:type IV pilin protein [Endozoicomonas gorgoniicola]MCW7554226.1 prepilin-type N-terminal cleavage/methylation domain-containing protein [Endozoicomonas gorgoniicola]
MKNRRGFSLIEMLVVLTIMGILSAIGIPRYQQYVTNSAIETGKTSLVSLAAAMERHRARTGTYAGAAAGKRDTGAPAIFPAHSPDDNSPYFNLTITAADSASYQLTATSTQKGTLGKGTLTLDSTGLQGGTDTLRNKW